MIVECSNFGPPHGLKDLCKVDGIADVLCEMSGIFEALRFSVGPSPAWMEDSDILLKTAWYVSVKSE